MNSKTSGLYDLFSAQAELTSGAVAVVHAGTPYTYRQLSVRSTQIAGRLSEMGVGRETPVAILLKRSPDLIASLLGVLKIGGTCVPLAPEYPKARLAMIVEDCGPPVLITERDLIHTAPSGSGEPLVLDEPFPEGKPNPERAVSGGDRSFIFYTSGSTGRPKGIEILHSAAVNGLRFMRRELDWSAQDVFCCRTPVSCDLSVLEIFLPLLTGAQIALAADEGGGHYMIEFFRRHRVTAMQMGPFYWRFMLEEGWKGSPGMKLLCGGETLTGDLARKLARHGRLWNLYGLTECSIWSTFYRCLEDEEVVPIGRPIENTDAVILDADRRPAAAGGEGEIYLGGAGLPRGYFNDPELTRERLIPDPISGNLKMRLLRTGDLGRVRPDGNIEFLGRMDHQIKCRGHRIEPGDIEAALNRHPLIRECAVYLNDDGALAAVIVATRAVDCREIRLFLSQKLPDYMIPGETIAVDSLPRTPNGKIDRNRLHLAKIIL